jgi:hypothetical protein
LRRGAPDHPPGASRLKLLSLADDALGVSTRKLAQRYRYLPSRIVDSVADLVEEL